MRISEMASRAAFWATDVPKQVFADVSAMSDALKIVQRINDLARPLIELDNLRLLSDAVSHVTNFIGARLFIGRIADIVATSTGRDPITPTHPNILRLARLSIQLVGDVCLAVKWLASIHVLDQWIMNATARIGSWAHEFNVMRGIVDLTYTAGNMIGLADTARMSIFAMKNGHYRTHAGHLNAGLLASHALDVAAYITKITATVLLNIPTLNVVFGTVALGIGSSLELGKFFNRTYVLRHA
jgi:hypothetical protein